MYGEVMEDLSVAQVVGARARELRISAGKKLEDVADAARKYGLPWSTGRVGDFEAGRAAPNLTTLVAATAALGDVIGRPVSLLELFAGKGQVQVNDDLSVPLAKLRAALSGEPVSVKAQTKSTPATSASVKLGPVETLAATPILMRFRESDSRMCKNIGVDTMTGAWAMAELWGKTFTAARDEIAGPGANAQHRGQIARQLKADLQEFINGND